MNQYKKKIKIQEIIKIIFLNLQKIKEGKFAYILYHKVVKQHYVFK